MEKISEVRGRWSAHDDTGKTLVTGLTFNDLIVQLNREGLKANFILEQPKDDHGVGLGGPV